MVSSFGFHAGGRDGFVAKFTSAGLLSYLTYIGSNANLEYASSIAVHNNEAYVTGFVGTLGLFFPLVSAMDATKVGEEAFVTKINAAGTGFVYSTYLGGDGGDRGLDIAVNSIGEAYVVGATAIMFGVNNFPMAGSPYDVTYSGMTLVDGEAFVAILDAAGSSLVYSSFLGGSGTLEKARSVTISSNNDYYVYGGTGSTDFPGTAGNYQSAHAADGGSTDFFIAHFDYATGGLGSGGITYFGGDGMENSFGGGIVLDESGTCDAIIIASTTSSTNFPTGPVGVHQQTKLNGGTSNSQPVAFKLSICGGYIPAISSPCILPVTLADLSVENIDNQKVNVIWKTATEQNSDRFIIERSADVINWGILGSVSAAGYSNADLSYSYIDYTPLPGNNYYRLNQVDYDGRSTYYGPVSTNILISELIVGNILPNPIEDVAMIDIRTPSDANIKLEVIDVTGNLVVEKSKNIIAGSNTVQIDLKHLSKGIYFLKTYADNNVADIQRLIKK